MKSVTIICPAYNEAAGIRQFLETLDQTLAPLSQKFRFRVVVVDDGSADATADTANTFLPNHFQLVVCQFTRNFGKEAAMLAGLERYIDDANILMDADLQHPPALIAPMLEAWQSGASIVEAVKADRGQENRLYRHASACFYGAMKLMSGFLLANHSDYKLLDNKVVHLLNQLPEKNRFLRGLVLWAGFPTVKLPFLVEERAQGRSSWSIPGLAKYALQNITAFTSAPLQLVTIIGILMLVFNVCLGGLTFYKWLSGDAVTGFTTVILLLLFIASVLMISLGIIGLYIALIYQEIKSRPIYVVAKEVSIPRKHDAERNE